jgi:hypothetical protein
MNTTISICNKHLITLRTCRENIEIIVPSKVRHLLAEKEAKMIRPLSVYLAIAAAILLLIGLVLPTGRGLSVMEMGAGQATEVAQLQAEEMGCAPAQGSSNPSDRPIFLTNFESFFSSSGGLCGKSSLSMLLTGKYWWANMLLIIPALLGMYAIFRLFIQPYARNHDKSLLLSSGILSLITLFVWWGIWVKFRAYPGIGFWISLTGALLLFGAGILAPQVDAFKERHHPHAT